MQVNTIHPNRPILSLSELERFDPQAPAGGRHRHFRCPLCRPTSSNPKNRCLGVNVETGSWRCFACQDHGQLREFWPSRSATPRRTLPTPTLHLPDTKPPADVVEDLRERTKRAQLIAGTAGAAYLEKRGIPELLAVKSDVRYSADWLGKPAVLFPLRNTAGELVAINGRVLDPRADPKALSKGAARMGVFSTPGAWEADPLIIVEAPIDALSLALCGAPALALIGTAPKDWLASVVGLRRVVLALDADSAGDEAARKIAGELCSFGSYVERWRPAGGKDWNELLLRHGIDSLAAGIAAALLEMPDPFSVHPGCPSDPAIPLELGNEDEAEPGSCETRSAAQVLLLAERLNWPARFIGGRGIHSSRSGWEHWAQTAGPEDLAAALADLGFTR